VKKIGGALLRTGNKRFGNRLLSREFGYFSWLISCGFVALRM